jgi:para-aminobenzoate synthetase component 1
MKAMEVIIEEIEVPASPLSALEKLPHPETGFLLESALIDKRLSRWSFLGAEPFLTFSAKGRKTLINRQGKETIKEGDPFLLLQQLLAEFAIQKPADSPPLLGGAIGYFSYDLCQLLEKLPTRAVDDINTPDCFLGFHDVIVAIDHIYKRAFICSTGWPERNSKKRGQRARQRLEAVREHLKCGHDANDLLLKRSQNGTLDCNFSREDYLTAIKKAKEYIAAGDIYQVNLSQRFSCPFEKSPLELYRRLRSLNPAPFAGLIQGEKWSLVSASPERFLQVRGDWVETRPIKGTRPRGVIPAEDERLAQELMASPKDRAENVMIVDLERNDLGKVCEFGSVQTTELCTLEKYPTVFHLVSTVEGKLRAEENALSCLRACFPGGSISGAPKIRAMEIIEELEPTKRGPYTGAMGYFCFSGDMDFNIIIRTFVVKNGRAYFQVGGGIVADSDPEAEYQETLDKGRALEWALTAREKEN